MIITGLIVLSVISYLFIDSRIIDYTDGIPVKYIELRKEVQDSLVWRGRHDGCVSIEGGRVDNNMVFCRHILK